MKRVVAITGCTADWGLLDSVLQPLLGRVHLTLVVLGSHRINAIYETADHVEVIRRPGMGDHGMADFAAQTAQFIPQAIPQAPDAVVLLGDRVEILTAAMLVRLLNCPIHHLYAGDRSGCVDDFYRDAISMLSNHLYVVSLPAWTRVVDFKRTAPDRIQSVDLVASVMVTDDSRVPNQKYAIARWHPETQWAENVEGWVREAVAKAQQEKITLYILPPNRDTGWEKIDKLIGELVVAHGRTVQRMDGEMTRAEYLGILKKAEWVRGNSSSFVLEAPLLRPRMVIIADGSRQARRCPPNPVAKSHMSDRLLQRINEC